MFQSLFDGESTLTFNLYAVTAILTMDFWCMWLVSSQKTNEIISNAVSEGKKFYTFLVPAIILHIVEFNFENDAFPEMKKYRIVCLAGLALLIVGEALRLVSIITAGINFNYKLQTKKKDEQFLVTSGVYAVCRHPSYLAMYLAVIGIELTAVNPIATIAFATISIFIIKQRIEEEEEGLVKMYGQQYVEYRQRVPSGIPFIS